jgi:AcrR family transcriptional regulator
MAQVNVRDNVVRAGLDQFHRVGFNGSSVEDITDLAAVPKGSFYNQLAGALLSAWEGALLRARVAGDSAPLEEFMAVGFGRLIA